MIIVTGGTGLVGSHLLLELLKQDKPVRALIREKSTPSKVMTTWKHFLPNPEKMLGNIEWYPGDITDIVTLRDALKDVDHVYHCAAKVSLDGTKRRDMFEANVIGTRNIVNACIQNNVKKLVHVSSIAAVGKSVNENSVSEADGWPVKSKSIYTRTKTLSELEVWRGISEGLSAVIVNPSVIIGPGNWEESSSRFFDMVYKGLKYYTLGETGFVDVNDVVAIMIELMNSDISGERFILSSDNLSIKTFFEKIANALGVEVPSRHATPFLTSLAWKAEFIKYLLTSKQPKMTRHSARTSHTSKHYSSDKIQKQLSFKFTSIDETIARTAKFYLEDI